MSGISDDFYQGIPHFSSKVEEQKDGTFVATAVEFPNLHVKGDSTESATRALTKEIHHLHAERALHTKGYVPKFAREQADFKVNKFSRY